MAKQIKRVEDVLDEKNLRFSEQARIEYQVDNVEDLVSNKDGLLETLLTHFKEHQAPRIVELWSYYEGNNAEITRGARRKAEDMADVRAKHNFARYISRFVQGYMTGNPIKIAYDDGNEASEMDLLIKELNDLNAEEAHESTLALHLSVTGRAFELIYRTRNEDTDADEDRFVVLDPAQTFLVKDTTVSKRPLAAVRFYKVPFGDEADERVEIYTKNETHYLRYTDGKFEETKASVTQYYNQVPINEYVNNETRQGDYETELDLIDLYDAAQSDTANYMMDLNDAILLIIGRMDVGDADESSEERLTNMKEMRRARLMQLIPSVTADGKEGSVDGKYIYKQYDVSGSEAYKDRIKQDIHLFTNTPDLSDDSFSGTQSGEAMKYKLFGLDQARAVKERYFKAGIRKRYAMIMKLKQTAAELSNPFDPLKLKVEFTPNLPNLPKTLKEKAEIFNQLEGELANETKMRITGIVDNPETEQAKLDSENPQSLLGEALFDSQTTTTTATDEGSD